MKRRTPRRLFASRKHDLLKTVDAVFVDANSNRYIVEAKGGAGKSHVLLQLLHAQSLLLNTESRLPPLTVDPPQVADFFISLVPLKHREPSLGDLEEEWNRLIGRHSLKTATFLYWAQVIYTFVGFWSRPLLGIAGVGWIRKLIEVLMNRFMK